MCFQKEQDLPKLPLGRSLHYLYSSLRYRYRYFSKIGRSVNHHRRHHLHDRCRLAHRLCHKDQAYRHAPSAPLMKIG